MSKSQPIHKSFGVATVLTLAFQLRWCWQSFQVLKEFIMKKKISHFCHCYQSCRSDVWPKTDRTKSKLVCTQAECREKINAFSSHLCVQHHHFINLRSTTSNMLRHVLTYKNKKLAQDNIITVFQSEVIMISPLHQMPINKVSR